MSEIVLDCKGLPCPQPVLQCKKSVEINAPQSLTVIVDNEAAKDNVSRFLGTKGYIASATENGGLFTVCAVRDGAVCEECEAMTDEQIATLAAPAGKQKILAFIASDVLGSGDDELGAKLMFNFIATLAELGDELWRVILVNGAVKLSTPENPCCEKIAELEKAGVSVLVCGTCLEHFNILSKKAVGETTNMLDVVTSMQLASKVIRA